jgi:hypothetical protein
MVTEAIAASKPAVTKALLEHLVDGVLVSSRQHIAPTFRLPSPAGLPPAGTPVDLTQVREMTGPVPPAGLEPAAKCLEGTCSIR